MAEAFKAAKQLLEAGDLEKALPKATEALNTLKAAKDKAAIPEVITTLVAVQLALEKFEDAKKDLASTREYFSKLGDKVGEAGTLVALAELHCAKQEVETALKLVSEAKALYPGIGAKALTTQVNACLLKGDGQEAMAAAKELLSVTQNSSDQAGQAAAWHAIASVHQMLEGSPDDNRALPMDVLQAAEKALDIYRQLKNRKGEATSLCMVAHANLKIMKVQPSLDAAEEALGIYREDGDIKGVVAALEAIFQAYLARDKPVFGIEAANKELAAVRSSSNKRGEVALLEMITHSHALLGQPMGAMKNAKEALEIYRVLKDEMGQGCMLHTIAEMQRALGDKNEAQKSAEESLAHFKKAGNKWGEEQALMTLSGLLVEKGLPEKAPKRKDAMKALNELSKAISKRDGDAVKVAEDKISAMGQLVSEAEISSTLVPLFQRDAGATQFLEELGWQFNHGGSAGGEGSEGSTIKVYPHNAFYLAHVLGGMGFGPQFRVCHPCKVLKDWQGPAPIAISVSQLPETEAWQMEMAFRPGILDSGLQCGLSHSFK